MLTELQFDKFQNILTSASWFHAWACLALELQTKNAIEITCWFQKNNIGDLQLRSWKRSWTARLQGWQERPYVRKTKTYFDKPILLLKRMILWEQENVLLYEYGLIIPTVLKCLFWHNLCKRNWPNCWPTITLCQMMGEVSPETSPT